ncbi:hypothetical protein ABPG74_010423 [Tetrahymena malaccensis]
MKVNRNLLQKLKEKNINLDIDKFSKQLRTQSNAPTQVSSSEVDSMDSSFMMQSINITPGAAALNSNIRIRPISAKREENGDILAQSQMGFSMTQSTFNRKESKKQILSSNSQYQQLIEMRLNQQSSQSSRSSASQPNKFRGQDIQSQQKSQTNSQNGNNIMVKTMTQSFYKSTKSDPKKDNGTKETQQQKPPLPVNNEQSLLRQSSIRDRQGSADPMRVSIYKDSEQNKIREQLLNYSGSEQLSDFIQEDDDNQIYEDQPNQLLKKTSSQKKSIEASELEYENDNQIVSFNKERGRSKDSKEDKLKKASSSIKIQNSRDNSEEQLDSQQKLDELLQEYDRMNNDDNNSQGNSFDDELMIQVQQEFISETITAELIEKITGVKQEDFDKIRRIAIRHDCEQDSLQILGEMCPNITELNINDSIANTLRDIGTSMRSLKILMISRVRLQDLSGLNAFPLLQELYASYNQIKNLNDLYFNENIEVLDLEGNEIADNDQIEVIETMSKVKILNLTQNPISKKEDYRQLIRQKLPQLQILDDIPIEQNVTEQTTSKTSLRRRFLPSSKGQQKNEEEEEEDLYEALKKLNWNGEKFLSDDIVKELDKELKQELPEEELLIYSVKKTMTKANKKLTIDENNPYISMKNSNIFGQTINNDFNSTSSNFRRPQTASVPTKNNNTNSTNPFAAKQTLPDSISSLVEGTDQAFYGNPLKALKHKRKNELLTTKKNDNIESETVTSMTIPKNIVNLLDQFKQETNDEGMNKLKEELKFYDFMVEQQINLQKKKSLGDAINQNQNEAVVADSSAQKVKVMFKRPQVKLRTASSQAQNETKNLQSDQQFNIQQQFKDLQVKSRLPVRPTLMQNKLLENAGK